VKFSTKLGGQARGHPKTKKPSFRTTTEQHQDKAQPAACNYLEFLLWCKEAASNRWLYHDNK